MSGLSKILKENDVHISKKGDISLNDFVEQIIGSKNPDNYMKSVKGKFIQKKKYYISQETCMELLAKGKSRKCKEIYTKILEENKEPDNTSIISEKDNIFQYEGKKFTSFFVIDENGERNVWVKAKEVVEYLEYNSTRRAIIDHVEDENKMSYKKLLEFYGEKNITKKFDKKTIFINYNGILQLICKSKQPKSIEFATFLNVPIFHKKTYHEMDIINGLSKFLKESRIKYELQYPVSYGRHKYRIDCYLLDYDIAIEIDEKGHSDRDPNYEMKREQRITKKLGCKFLRCNPDDPNFSLFGFIGLINRKLINRRKIHK
jgi:hypothetical protein